MRGSTALLISAALLAHTGCHNVPVDDAPLILRESDPPTPTVQPEEPKLRFGYDRFGRLNRATELVQGFEVPLGLKLVKRTATYLEFEVKRPLPELHAFYSGRDPRTGRAFKEPGYAVAQGKYGFDVKHTPISRRRLGLDERYKNAFVYVTNRLNRWQTLRIHVPPQQLADRDNPFIPRINFENSVPTTAPPTAEPNEPRGPRPGDWKPPTVTPDPDNPGSPSKGGVAHGSAGTGSNSPGGSRRADPGVDESQQVREWLAKNPGRTFLD